jgi:hypothetical protein
MFEGPRLIKGPSHLHCTFPRLTEKTPHGPRRAGKALIAIVPPARLDRPSGARELKGFGVRVSTNEKKTYVVRYRTIGRADRLVQIARHGVVTAEEARDRAVAVLATVAADGDPQAVKVERREELTMSELCDLVG